MLILQEKATPKFQDHRTLTHTQYLASYMHILVRQ